MRLDSFKRLFCGASILAVFSGVTLALAPAATATRAATGLSVAVGYADDTRPNPTNFPTPWSGGTNVNFIGSSSPWDAGAIMLQNPTRTPITVDGVNVDLQRSGGGPMFNLWGSNITVPAHGSAVLTQTTQYNFDTSDASPIEPCNIPAPPTLDPPKVTVTVGGTPTDFIDSGHVLDTSGFDSVCRGNESIQWTPIGSAPCPGSVLKLTPTTQVVVPGAMATEMAKFSNCVGGLPGVTVHFAVTSGPNAGVSGSAVTNSNGVAAFSYTGGQTQGIDFAQATVTNTVGTIASNTANVYWETATLTVNPTSGLPGSTINFTGTGYASAETVTLFANAPNGPQLTTAVASPAGAISGSFLAPVPTASAPLKEIVAVGAASARQGWALFSLVCSDDWTAAASGDFNTPANWSTGSVPGSSSLACIIVPGTYTVSMTQSNVVAGLVLGNAASGTQTLDLAGRNLNFSLGGPSTISPHGALVMDSPDGNYSLLGGPGPLTNAGSFSTVNANGSQRYIRTNVTNALGGTSTIGNFDTRIDSNNTFTNKGTFRVTAGGGISVTNSGFTQGGGSLSVASTGSFYNGTSAFTASGGSIAGTIVLNNSTLADSKGKATFILQCSNTLSGTIPAGQTVNVQGNACGSAQTTLSGTAVVNNGTLEMDSTNGNYAMISGSPLTNNGKFTILQHNGGQRYIRANVSNATGSSFTVGDFDTRIDVGNTFTNNGTATVAAGAALAVTNSHFTQAGGTLTVPPTGSLASVSSTFTLSGGATSGSVVLNNSTLVDSGGTGGLFVLECSNNLSGIIQASQTVNVQGNGCGNASTNLAGASVINNGMLELDSTNGNYALIQGSPLTNNGTFATLQDGGGTRYIRVGVTNGASGTVSLGAGSNQQDNNTATTNTTSGTLSVADGARLILSSGSSFSQGANGTFDAAVDAANGAFGISGGSVSVAGTLIVTTTGNPPIGNSYAVISGTNLSGTFSTVITGSTNYSVAYSSSAVTLTRTA
jgi:hypothetical protein